MKNYYGKKYLYNFLLAHGYDVPPLKQMRYIEADGLEWLKGAYIEVEAEYIFFGRIEVKTSILQNDTLFLDTKSYCDNCLIFHIKNEQKLN